MCDMRWASMVGQRLLVVVLACLVVDARQVRAQSVHAVATAVAGGQGSSQRAYTSQTSLRLQLAADWTRDAPPVSERGLVRSPGRCCFFVLVGLEDVDVDGVEFSVDSELLGQRVTTEQRSLDFVFGQQAHVRWGGWRARQWMSYQPANPFNAAFWRPATGHLELGLGVEVPPVWGMAWAPASLLWVGAMNITYATVAQRSRGRFGDVQHDLGFELEGGGLRHGRFDARIFTIRFHELAVPTASMGSTTTGLSVTALDAQLLELSWSTRHNLSVRAHGGLSLRSPLAPFEVTTSPNGASSRSFVDPVAYPDVWLQMESGQRDRNGDWTGDGAALGVGTVSRIAPLGTAVDTGMRVNVSAAYQVSRHVQTLFDVDATVMTRAKVSMETPGGLSPGTRLRMGRATGSMKYALGERWHVLSRVWAERSDRDDPRWLRSSVGGVESRFGLDVSVSSSVGVP